MGIPYRIYGGLSFYQRKEIKDIIAYFRLVANPDRRTAAAPVLHRRTIYGLLRSGSRMYGSHKTFDDAELVVDDLGQRSQAVGRARCVRYDILACVGIGSCILS